MTKLLGIPALLGVLLSPPARSAGDDAGPATAEVRLLKGRELSGEVVEARWVGEAPGWITWGSFEDPFPDLGQIGALSVGGELLWFGPRHDFFFSDGETVVGVTLAAYVVTVSFRTMPHPGAGEEAEVVAAERLRHSQAKIAQLPHPRTSRYEWRSGFVTSGIWGVYALANYEPRLGEVSQMPFRPFGMKGASARKDEEGRWVVVVHGENGARGELVFSEGFGRIDEARLAGELVFEWEKHKDRKVHEIIVEDGVVKPVPPPPPPPPVPPGQKARRALAAGDLAEVERMLDAGEVGIDDDLGARATLLSEAVVGRKPNIVEWLLERGADIEKTNGFQMTPLMEAVRHENLAMVDLLLEKGADVNAWRGGEINTKTAIHYTLRDGTVEMVTRLIDAGADLEARLLGPGGYTPMLYAAHLGRDDLVKLMIDRGADTKAKTSSGSSLDKIRESYRKRKARREREELERRKEQFQNPAEA